MLIAHISDLHIGAGDGRANDQRLSAVVARLKELSPDLVLVTGDITEHGDAASYRRAKALLADLSAPALFGLGNHDRRAPFMEAFPETSVTDGFVQYAHDVGDMRIVMLDTLEEGRDGGAFCERRAARLEALLAERPEHPVLLALHHPPAPTGVPWMDVNTDGPWTSRLRAIVARHPSIIGLVAGHVHRATSANFAGKPLITASSTSYQIAFDTRPIEPLVPDDRRMIIAHPPGFALHRWRAGRLVTDFMLADDARVIVRYDDRMQPVVAKMAEEPPI